MGLLIFGLVLLVAVVALNLYVRRQTAKLTPEQREREEAELQKDIETW